MYCEHGLPGIAPLEALYSGVVLLIMNGNGSQKNARRERLKLEIVDYISSNPNCSAADIVYHLSNTRKMRNHGLTSRKIGFFIPRYLKNIINFKLDSTTGKRIYSMA